MAANLAATVLRFLLFRAWVFPDRGDSAEEPPLAALNSPSSPTYSTAPQSPQHPQYPGSYAPLPQRQSQQGTYDTASTTQFRAGEAADGTWRDATMQLQPVRPHDTDPRNSR